MSRLILLAAAIALPQIILRAESGECVPRTPCLKQKVEGWKQRLSCLKPNIQLPLRQACPPSRCIPTLPRCEPSRFRVPTCIPKIGACRALCQPRCQPGCQPGTRFEERCRSVCEPVRQLFVPRRTTSQFTAPDHGATRLSVPVEVRAGGPATRMVNPRGPRSVPPPPEEASRTIVIRPALKLPDVPAAPSGIVPPLPTNPAPPTVGARRVVVQNPAAAGNSKDIVRSLEDLVASRKAASVKSNARLDGLEVDLKRLNSKVDRLTKAVAKQNARLKDLERTPAAN